MPGLISPSSAESVGAIAGMKRPCPSDAVDSPPKKRKTLHMLNHKQPIEYIQEPLGEEFGADSALGQGFFNQQLDRAIAIQCRTAGFDGARPEVMGNFRALVDQYMTDFLSQVRVSMCSSRRTEPVPHDWIYALTKSGLRGSSALEPHLDIGETPPSLLQQSFAAPEPPETVHSEIESLLGPELSGRAEKESKKYIPAHFPPFPPKHSYKATPVFTRRENDPRKIREKATEEGISAEQSLRKLMAAQKAGLQKQEAGKRKRSKRMKESDKLWQEAMKDCLEEEAEREEKEKQRQAGMDDAELNGIPLQHKFRREVNLEEGVHVNYNRKFWRKSARGV